MAIYRNIPINIWEDAKMADDFTPEDRLFWLYLITNSKTTMCGCYEVNLSKMSTEIGYTKAAIENLIERFEKVHEIIKYDKETREILLLNWYKYNWSTSPNALKGIKYSIDEVKSDSLRNLLNEMLENYTVGKPLTRGIPTTVLYCTDTVSVSDTVDSNIDTDVNSIDTDDNNQVQEQTDSIEDKFNEFWDKYPRKTNKQKAFKAFKALKPSNKLLETIYTALELQKKSEQWEEVRFIPHASTWLNGKRWLDEIPKSRPPERSKKTKIEADYSYDHAEAMRVLFGD